MKHLKIVFGLIWLAGAAQAQQRYELSVKEAVDVAYKNVIELKNAQVDYRIQEAQNKEIFGQALPQLSASASIQYYLKLPQVLFPQSDEGVYSVLKRENLVPSTTKAPPAVLVPFSFQQPWNFTVGPSLQQLLFQPDVFVGLQARQTALNLSAAVIEQTREKIKDSAYKRYYAILIAEKQLYFLNEGVKRLEKLYNDDSIMYKNGFAEHLDLERVQVQLNNLRTTQNVVGSAITLSYAALKFALGLSQQDTVVLRETLTNETVKQDLLDESFAYENRAEIRTLGFTKELQELDVKRYKLGYLPTVSLSSNYGITGQGKKFITSDQTTWFKSSYVGMNVNLPIFDGFQRKYKTRQSQLNLEKVENNITFLKQAIDFEQVVTKESLKSALLNLDIQDRNLALAEKVYNSTKLKFEQGLGSSFEVLQADTDYQTSQSNYFNALYNAITARISYQYALGKL